MTCDFAARVRIIAATALLLVLPGAEAAAAGNGITLSRIATVDGAPLAVRHAGDGSGRIYVVTRSGTIRVLERGELRASPFLDLRDRVRSGGEQGLLGLAFHPDYAGNGYLYVNYTTRGLPRTRISRFRVRQDDPLRADPGSEQVLLEIGQPYSNHNGGDIHFGKDGYLYIGMGDGGSGGDPEDRARRLDNLLGKMLRIDVDRTDAGDAACGLRGRYAIPEDNPFTGSPGACPEIWAYGLRNPWRWSFDRESGDLIIADVGQNRWEEVDFQPAVSRGGENYGWSCREGRHPYRADRCDGGPRVDPVIEYGHADGDCSITGGYRYRGPVTALRGLYVYGDFCTGRVWFADRKWNTRLWRETGFNIASFGEDEAGNLYLVDLNGGIYRFGQGR